MKHFSHYTFASLLMAALSAFAQVPQTDLPRAVLSAGIHQIHAQVARSEEQHAIGLMYRTEMPQHEGMLFEFKVPSRQCFWMKNTFIPLTAAFIADDGTIVNLEDMQAQTTLPHCSIQPVRYVLEVNQGWFASRGLKVGTKLRGAGFETTAK